MHKNVTFTLIDILHNMRNMYNNYSLYLLNSYYRSQEVLSSVSTTPYDRLSFYPYVWKLMPNVCNKYQYNCKPFYQGKTLSYYFRQLHVDYNSVYDDGFLRSDFYDKMSTVSFVKANQDKLLTQIQNSDYKKKFNDLYKF